MNLGRKITGGKYHSRRKRRLHEKSSPPRTPSLGKTKRKEIRIMGGNKKIVILKADTANLVDKNNKIKKVKIINVIETPQNRFFSRQNFLMKGAIIETELGKARITNRPGQEGYVNAKLIEN